MTNEQIIKRYQELHDLRIQSGPGLIHIDNQTVAAIMMAEIIAEALKPVLNDRLINWS